MLSRESLLSQLVVLSSEVPGMRITVKIKVFHLYEMFSV